MKALKICFNNDYLQIDSGKYLLSFWKSQISKIQCENALSLNKPNTLIKGEIVRLDLKAMKQGYNILLE